MLSNMSSFEEKKSFRDNTIKSKKSPHSVMTKMSDLTISSNATAKIYTRPNYKRSTHEKHYNNETVKSSNNKTEIIFSLDKLQIFDADVGTNTDTDSETVTTNVSNITSSTDITVLNSNLRPLLPKSRESITKRGNREAPTSYFSSSISYSTRHFSNANEYDETHAKPCMLGNCDVYLSLGSSHFNKKATEQIQSAFERAYSLAISSSYMGSSDDIKDVLQNDDEVEVENSMKNKLPLSEKNDSSPFSSSPKLDRKMNSSTLGTSDEQTKSYLRRGNEHFKVGFLFKSQ